MTEPKGNPWKQPCAACGSTDRGVGNLGQPSTCYTIEDFYAPVCAGCSAHNNLRDCECDECSALVKARWEAWISKARERRAQP